MITISLCMIVKNEENVLSRCLDCAKDIVDEIIIVDTGSTDKTKEIAYRYTDKVFDFTWINDFSAARNYSFSKAAMEYCMWLDADDIILDIDKEKFLILKNTINSDADILMMKYNTSFDTDGNPSFLYYRERIIKNHSRFLWSGAVHETIAPSGIIEYSDIAITHKKTHPGDPDRNLKIFENLIKNNRQLTEREQFYYARELFYHKRYDEAVCILNGFLDCETGWVENKIEACRQLSLCYYAIGKENHALESLLKSLKYDSPRAEICCDIGKHFLDRNMYKQAIFWYKSAATIKRNDKSGGFIIPDCYGYIPYMQLCVLYDKTGDKTLAEKYNEMAGQIKPNSPAYLHNKAYFKNIIT